MIRSMISRVRSKMLRLDILLYVVLCAARYKAVVAFSPASNSVHLRPPHSDALLPRKKQQQQQQQPLLPHVDRVPQEGSVSRTTTRLHAIITNDDIRPGRLIEYLPPSASKASPSAASKTILGAIIKPDGKKNWKILTSSGRITSIHPRTIQHILPKITGAFGTEGAQVVLRHEDAAQQALADDVQAGGADVAEIWEMLLEEEEDTTDLATLAELLLGEEDATSLSCYATRALLLYGVENACFKPSAKVENAFETRPVEIVEQLRNKAKMEAALAAKWEALNGRIRGDSEGGSSFLLDEEDAEVQAAFVELKRLGCLANLEEKRIEDEIAKIARTDLEKARSFLQRLGRKGTPDAARTVLTQTGIWHQHENLDMIRLNVPTDFSPYLLEEARKLEELQLQDAVTDLDAGRRMDLTHLPAYAIDEASTVEIDDALSLELIPQEPSNDNDGDEATVTKPPSMNTLYRIWIHIADPTRYIPLHSPLSNEARFRSSSVYLPTGTIPMFPLALAAGPLCLRPNTVAPALSIGVSLNEFGGIDPDKPPIITPSYVRTNRLTYRQVDKALCDPFEFESMHGEDEAGDDNLEGRTETVEELRRLLWMADQRLQWRKEGGSLESIGSYDLPDMSVKVNPTTAGSGGDKNDDSDDGWEVVVTARKRFTASRIVTELMLLGNEAIAKFGQTNDIPLPYRSQKIYTPSDEEVEATPDGPCRSWLAIRATTKTVVSGAALPHEGLGLDAYVQATSPVRRFADLAVHYQVKAFLRGEEDLPFSGGGVVEEGAAGGEEKEDIIRLAQEGGSLSRQLERWANDYWLREFFRRKAGEPVAAFVLEADRRERNRYKVLLPELGSIFDHQSSRPLEVGAQMEMMPDKDGTLIS